MGKVDSTRSCHILDLSVELLVYIVSFLSTSDKMKLRYVSRSTQVVVSESPSLWRQFLLPQYDYRQERSVMNVLRMCGDYIKRLTLPGHMRKITVFQMLGHCNNILSLCLLSTEIHSEELKIALSYMAHLEKLEIQFCTDIKPLFHVGKLKDLSVHVPEEHCRNLLYTTWVKDWARNRFIPYNLNLFTEKFGAVEEYFIWSFLQWDFTPLTDYTSCFKWYYEQWKPPLDLYPLFPEFQVEFGQTLVLPFVKLDNFGIHGLTCDSFALTGHVYNGKNIYKIWSTRLVSSNAVSNVLPSLNFVTEVSFASVSIVTPGHLEQLAIACPNIERLNLQSNGDCLTNLRGLQTIVCRCHNFCGLNLGYVPVTSVENHLKLWKILSEAKLIYLLIDLCIIYPRFKSNPLYDKQLCGYFEKCTSLLALQVESFYVCVVCRNSAFDWSMLSHFPALSYCRIDSNHPNVLQDVLIKCKKLTIFQFNSCEIKYLITSAISYTNLQQFSINAYADIPDVFLQAVSAHGGLVHVVLTVAKITKEGICILINNSPELLTLYVWSEERLCKGCSFDINDERDLKYKFHMRKLFTIGKFSFSHFYLNNVSGTDILPLWPSY